MTHDQPNADHIKVINAALEMVIAAIHFPGEDSLDLPSDVFYDFFLQAEAGMRVVAVTGVQTCALPILMRRPAACCPRTHRPGCGRSGGEALTQGGGEGVRLAGLTVLAAEEPAVVARERDGRDPEPSDRKSVV